MSSGGFAIRARGIGKNFELGPGATRGALYDRVGSLISGGRFRPAVKRSMWALRNVDLEVQKGEIFGVIGRNGSGKTTLLSILARVTAPTEGTAEIRGRVAPLLQVGTGFHPQLTGRDNIALSGAILGMTAKEVADRFDAIADFSEIGEFIDQPVKHYSSGMYSRLAFSVSAFLPAEIMLLDEILSVGDAQFAKKSHEHMLSTIGDGRSVVYVGHNLSVISKLCRRAIVLESGSVAFEGNAKDAVDFYEHIGPRRPAAITETRRGQAR